MRITADHHRVQAAAGWMCCLLVAGGLLSTQVAAQQGRPTAQPPARPPAREPAAPPPEVVIAGIRVVGTGFGANGSELRPFHERPGTAIVLAVSAPPGSGIVE